MQEIKNWSVVPRQFDLNHGHLKGPFITLTVTRLSDQDPAVHRLHAPVSRDAGECGPRTSHRHFFVTGALLSIQVSVHRTVVKVLHQFGAYEERPDQAKDNAKVHG